jgi:hypothetical protein
MLAQQLETAVMKATNAAQIDNLARLLWRGYGENLISDIDAERIVAVAEAQKATIRGRTRPPVAKPTSGHLFASQRPSNPDHRIRRGRRRRCASSGAMPPPIAAHFTTGEAAALSIIVLEFKRRGFCDQPLNKLAALAGVSRTTLQNAIRYAVRLGLISVTERRFIGKRNGYNLIRITDPAWISWIKNRTYREPSISGGAFKNLNTMNTNNLNPSNKTKKMGFDHSRRSPFVLLNSTQLDSLKDRTCQQPIHSQKFYPSGILLND